MKKVKYPDWLKELARFILAGEPLRVNPPEPISTPSAEHERYVTKAQVAAHLKLTQRSVTKWMSKGMPYYAFGKRRTRFKLSEVDKFFRDK